MKQSAGSKWRRMWVYTKDRKRAKRSDSKWERQHGKRAAEQQSEDRDGRGTVD